MEEVYYGVANASVLVSVVFAILSILIFPNMKKIFRLFLIFIIIGGSIDLISVIFAEYKMNNLKFIHLYTFLEFGVLSVFFNQLTYSINSKIDLRHIYIPVLILFVLNSCFFQKLEIYNSYSSTLGSIVILGYCIYTFYLMLDYPMRASLTNLKWLVIGVFVTHSVLLIVMLSSNVILNISSDYRLIIWTIRAFVFLCTKLLFFAIVLKELRTTSKILLDGGR